MLPLNHHCIVDVDDNKKIALRGALEDNRNRVTAEPIKILYVEDDKDSRELLDFILCNEGFEVVLCPTSEEGLKLAKKDDFFAIILDYRLAEISGVEICREIRTYDKQTPIIFYSASAYPKEVGAGLAAGANAYLVKPNDLDKIAETIKKLVTIKSEKISIV